MKKWFILLVCCIVILGSVSSGNAEMREPINGTGWHYPWKDTYSKWKPGNMQYDKSLFDQDVIKAYGWEAEDVDKIKDLIPPSIYRILKIQKSGDQGGLMLQLIKKTAVIYGNVL